MLRDSDGGATSEADGAITVDLKPGRTSAGGVSLSSMIGKMIAFDPGSRSPSLGGGGTSGVPDGSSVAPSTVVVSAKDLSPDKNSGDARDLLFELGRSRGSTA